MIYVVSKLLLKLLPPEKE
ncbi:hypothetical protein [Lacticaseibacillus baoqingensis]|nr:hypothetical protein [Lacticaseibacillus baoqingensis]